MDSFMIVVLIAIIIAVVIFKGVIGAYANYAERSAKVILGEGEEDLMVRTKALAERVNEIGDVPNIDSVLAQMRGQKPVSKK